MKIALNPKARFQAMDSLAKQHRELVVSTGFTTTIELALLQYMSELISVSHADPVVSEAQSQRIMGANDFIKVLLNLGEKVEFPERKADPHRLIPTK